MVDQEIIARQLHYLARRAMGAIGFSLGEKLVGNRSEIFAKSELVGCLAHRRRSEISPIRSEKITV